MSIEAAELLREMVATRVEPAARDWLDASWDAIADGLPEARFAALFSMASRHARSTLLAPTPAEVEHAGRAISGWSPELWTLRDALRAILLRARPDLEAPGFATAFESLFTYADEGETCALYRSLVLLPDGPRFRWRAGEGCRTNMRSVFEAIACDTPYPARHLDDAAWCQLAIKAVFIGAPLWRIRGLDERLGPELARMALDLIDERHSAGRPIQSELWACLGSHGAARAIAAIERELRDGSATGRAAAALALARAGEQKRMAELADETGDGALAQQLRQTLDGPCDQRAFAPLVTQGS